MLVESKALDDAFANGPCLPRQRLISASIDYTIDEVDCATVEFTDPDGKIAQCIRTAPTKEGNKLIFVPWTVRIGYWGQSSEEMTKLIGVPQMEFSDFPETGDPVVRLKILNSTVMLKTNTAPGGDPANYLEPLVMMGSKGPFRLSLDEVAKFYGLELDLGSGAGSLEPVIQQIDKWIEESQKSPQFNAERIEGKYDNESGVWTSTPIPDLNQLCRVRKYNEKNRTDPGTIESDYDWLRRVAAIVTSLIQSDQIDMSGRYREYFNPVLPGKVAVSDLKVIVGIRAEKLVFKLSYDFIMENGFSQGIPVLDYRNGNCLLRSFTPSADNSNDSMGWWATLFGNKKKQKGDVDAEPPLTDADIRSSDSPAEIDPWMVEKRLFFPQSSMITTTSVVAWIDELKRHLSTGVAGTAQTFGIPKLLAGQLVGFAGLGWRPAAEVATDASAAEKQPFANYNRLYLVSQAHHAMSSSGLYEMSLKVSGCALDGSETKVIKSFLDRLSKGVEFTMSSTGILGALFGSTI